MKSKKMPTSKLIHVGKIRGSDYLFLHEELPNQFVWFDKDGKTDICADSIEEAIKQAHRKWKAHGFETLKCGFKYTLPERDEHGINAYFCDMVESFNSLQGAYFDPDFGHMCEVKNPSLEALQLWKKLKTNG